MYSMYVYVHVLKSSVEKCVPPASLVSLQFLESRVSVELRSLVNCLLKITTCAYSSILLKDWHYWCCLIRELSQHNDSF